MTLSKQSSSDQILLEFRKNKIPQQVNQQVGFTSYLNKGPYLRHLKSCTKNSIEHFSSFVQN